MSCTLLEINLIWHPATRRLAFGCHSLKTHPAERLKRKKVSGKKMSTSSIPQPDFAGNDLVRSHCSWTSSNGRLGNPDLLPAIPRDQYDPVPWLSAPVTSTKEDANELGISLNHTGYASPPATPCTPSPQTLPCPNGNTPKPATSLRRNRSLTAATAAIKALAAAEYLDQHDAQAEATVQAMMDELDNSLFRNVSTTRTTFFLDLNAQGHFVSLPHMVCMCAFMLTFLVVDPTLYKSHEILMSFFGWIA
jgi:hypothetical protein